LKNQNLKEITYEQFFQGIQYIDGLNANYKLWENYHKRSNITDWGEKRWVTRIGDELKRAKDLTTFERKGGRGGYLYMVWRRDATAKKAYGFQNAGFWMQEKECEDIEGAEDEVKSVVSGLKKHPGYTDGTGSKPSNKEFEPEDIRSLHELVDDNLIGAVKKKIRWLIHNKRAEEINAKVNGKTPLELAMEKTEKGAKKKTDKGTKKKTENNSAEKSTRVAVELMHGLRMGDLDPDMDCIVQRATEQENYSKIEAIIRAVAFELQSKTLEDLYMKDGAPQSLKDTLEELYEGQIRAFASDVTRRGPRHSRRNRTQKK
jgi:hypothetical protein